ncbi:hypothetical protein ACFLZB_00830 [Nanoarchaeota archaeon]
MLISLIIVGIIFLVVLAILFKFAKKAFKIVFIASLVLGVVLTILGFFIYQDAMELKDQFPVEEKLVLLEHQDQILAGFQGKLNEGEDIILIDDIQPIQEEYQQEQLEEILGSNYKILIINSQAFENVNTVYLADKDRPREEIISYLESETALDDFIVNYLQESGVPVTEETKAQALQDMKSQQAIETDDEFKAILFGQLLQETMEDQGQLFIIFQLKNNNLEIYPETIIFKIIKILPLGIVEDLTKTIQNGNLQ